MPGLHSHSTPEASVLPATAPLDTAARTAASEPAVVVVAEPDEPHAAANVTRDNRATDAGTRIPLGMVGDDRILRA